MTDLTAPQRALHAYLLAYRGQGLSQSAVAGMTLAESSDLGRLVEAGLVELRFMPVSQPQAFAEASIAPAIGAGSIGVRDRHDHVAPPGREEPAPPSEDGSVDDRVVEPSSPPPASEQPMVDAAPIVHEQPVRRTRVSAWTADRKAKFVAAIAAGKSQADAHVAAGFHRDAASAYYQRKMDPEFAAAWDRARAAADAADKETARPFVPAPASSDDVELDGAQRRDVPAGTGDDGDDPVPQRQGDRADPRGKPSLGEMAAEDRPQPLGHRGVAPRLNDGEIARQALAREAEMQRIAALRPLMTAEEAKLILQRAGWAVYRASVVGGRNDRWAINGVGKDLTDTDLIERAERAEERRAA